MWRQRRLSTRSLNKPAGWYPITFVVIVGTVAVYGLTLGPLARWLGVAKAERGGILFAGAEPFVRAIAKILHTEGIDVLLIDTNQRNIAKARMEGLRTCYASVLSEHVQEELDLSGIGSFLAMTPNDEVNSLAAMEFAGVFGRAGIYQLTPDASDVLRQSQVSQYLRARLLFSEQATSSHLRNRLARGGVIKRTGLSTEFDFGQFQQMYGDDAIVLFVIHKSGQVEICSAESSIEPTPGQTLISLVDEV